MQIGITYSRIAFKKKNNESDMITDNEIFH